MNKIKTKEDLEEMKEQPLSNYDFEEMLHTNIFTYPHLQNISHIDEIFDRNGRAIMLFLTDSPTNGHWISLIKRGNQIEFFDPQGFKPETQGIKLGGSMDKMKEWGQDQKLFTKLVNDAGQDLVQNKKRLQPISTDINTCGRHAIMRLMFSSVPLEQYYKILNQIKNDTGIVPDDLVTALTGELLGK